MSVQIWFSQVRALRKSETVAQGRMETGVVGTKQVTSFPDIQTGQARGIGVCVEWVRSIESELHDAHVVVGFMLEALKPPAGHKDRSAEAR
jgi:hypothetical protein